MMKQEALSAALRLEATLVDYFLLYLLKQNKSFLKSVHGSIAYKSEEACKENSMEKCFV